jgi:alanine transaminase
MSKSNGTSRQKALSTTNINPAVLEVEYAVRGELALKADKYMTTLSSGEGGDLPFKKVVTANIGNPQQKGLDQQPITYWRQVISLLEYPDMMQGDLLPIAEKIYPKDVLKRATGLWEEIGSVGAYSPSKGLLGIRKRVAKFLEGEFTSAARVLPPGRSIIPSSLGRLRPLVSGCFPPAPFSVVADTMPVLP